MGKGGCSDDWAQGHQMVQSMQWKGGRKRVEELVLVWKMKTEGVNSVVLMVVGVSGNSH